MLSPLHSDGGPITMITVIMKQDYYQTPIIRFVAPADASSSGTWFHYWVVEAYVIRHVIDPTSTENLIQQGYRLFTHI